MSAFVPDGLSTEAPAPTSDRAITPTPAHRLRWSYRLGATAVVAASSLMAAVPAYAVPPTPVAAQPPGTQGLNTMLGWGSWVMSFACVLGIIIVAAIMAIKHRRGGGEESMGALGWVLGACVLGTASGPIAGALIA